MQDDESLQMNLAIDSKEKGWNDLAVIIAVMNEIIEFYFFVWL